MVNSETAQYIQLVINRQKQVGQTMAFDPQLTSLTKFKQFADDATSSELAVS